MSNQESILLTGATGNVGAVTLEHLLATTHEVNIVLRNADKQIPVFKTKFPKAISSGQLTFTSIPDMTVPRSFDEPAASATAIIHIATPLGDGKDYVKSLIEPTWTIDHNILEAAKKSNTVKRVIICGSLVQALRWDTHLRHPEITITEASFNDTPFEMAANASMWGTAYGYAKSEAERRTWAWAKENEGKIKFDVVVLLPPNIMGRSPQVAFNPENLTSGGISFTYQTFFKGEEGLKQVDMGFPFWLDNDDVARCHVLSLDKANVKGNERYLLAHKQLLDFRATVVQVRKKYPELAKRLPEVEGKERDYGSELCKVDTAKADRVFGSEWKGVVESMKATVEDIIRWEDETGQRKG
ncbi:hypothetical protein BDV96DRAFT_319671 [Lophiotrema nucula]|uniref:NAD-dependent epimerase/dehydratase domain-containing protein n=1 Tax=Lophiotrema nucula TaxID=690887 RepID=A0A6A5ZLB5_9PLEO|nr:hypothetical protein BDV96DRAFT_319671 [Lophiotrema nucula]